MPNEDDDQEKGTKNYKISIDGPGVEISKEVSGDTFATVIAVLFGSGEGARIPGFAGAADPTESSDQRTSRPNLSPAEFLQQTNASTNRERIAAFAWYASEHLEQDGILQDDLPDLFRRAHQSVPKNMRRDVRQAKRDGLVDEHPEDSDQLYVTQTGRETLRSE